MEIYERIKSRRKELGLTADAVADALVVSRATVYRYESADIEKLPITIIEPLSRVLSSSPAWIMGWTDNTLAPIDSNVLSASHPSDPTHPVQMSVDDREAEHLQKYRYIDDFGRDRVDALLNIEYEQCRREKERASTA